MKIDVYAIREVATRLAEVGGSLKVEASGLVLGVGDQTTIVPWELIVSDHDGSEKILTEVKKLGYFAEIVSVPPVEVEHDTVIQGDEYVCRNCGKRWGFDDHEVPECS